MATPEQPSQAINIPLGFQFVTLPLTKAYSNKNIGVRGNFLVVVNCPIEVYARVNRTGGDLLPLHRLQALQAKIQELYITTSGTSSEDLELLVFDDPKAVNVGFGAVVTLQDSIGVKYDARDITQSEEYNNADNINTGTTKDTGELATTGYNKVTGWILCDVDITVNYYAYLSSGGTARLIDSVSHTGSATQGTGFSFELVSGYILVEFDNSSGTNSTTCETVVSLSSGA